jgi:nucleoid DNA-binding protein
MTRTELINYVAQSTDLTKKEIKVVLNQILINIMEALERGEKVPLIGFGTFFVKKKRGGVRFSPSLNEQVIVPDKNVVKFSASEQLSAMLNKNHPKYQKFFQTDQHVELREVAHGSH